MSEFDKLTDTELHNTYSRFKKRQAELNQKVRELEVELHRRTVVHVHALANDKPHQCPGYPRCAPTTILRRVT